MGLNSFFQCTKLKMNFCFNVTKLSPSPAVILELYRIGPLCLKIVRQLIFPHSFINLFLIVSYTYFLLFPENNVNLLYIKTEMSGDILDSKENSNFTFTEIYSST